MTRLGNLSGVKSKAEALRRRLREQLAQVDELTGRGTERASDAARKREKRATEKVVVIPPCADRARREKLEADDIQWLMYYFGPGCDLEDPFTYEFVDQQRQMIEDFRNAILYGGDQAEAAPRGEGKSTILERMTIKYTLQGVLSYTVIFQATGALAENSLDTIKTAFQDNPLLLADYPEVCVPVQALEHAPQRSQTQRVNGFRHDNGEPYEMAFSHFTWSGQEVIFPNVPGSPSARAIIATRGLDAAVRGLKKRGRRPQLAAIDDPDTEETSRSADQAKKLEDRIDKTIAGLGSQTRPIARIMLCTIQSRTAVAYKYTDPEQKPSWKGRRMRFLLKPPLRKDLWDEYVQLMGQEWKDYTAGKSKDKHCRRSHQFYLDHPEMNDGAVVANPHRFDATALPDGSQVEASALQHYYNQVARTCLEDVQTEYDSDPPADEGTQQLVLTAYHIQHNCLSGTERRIVPEGTAAIVRGVDVRKLGLDFVDMASDDRGAGAVIDYDFFEFQTEGKKAADCEVLILEGLFDWYEKMLKHPFLGPGGEPMFADLTLIDTGWKEESWVTQPVQVFCSQVGYQQFMPCKGMSPYYRPKPARHLVIGDNWHWDANECILYMNADHWKLKVHEGFLADDGEPGSLRIFNPPQTDGRTNRTFHLSYSHHILAETWETRFKPGFKGSRTGWWKSPKPNHKFDATYEAVVARSVRGISVLGAPQLPAAAAPQPAQSQTIVAPPGAGVSRNRW